MESKYPVVEIFGPTIQGEGIDQGVPCYFIRFGGCDYRCEWCDSPYAVLPTLVRKNSTKMTVVQILDQIRLLPPGPEWIIFSGGNPLLHELEPLVRALHALDFNISVETQGTRWKKWVQNVERVAVSPKPPSSGWRTSFSVLQGFMQNMPERHTFLKIVIFDSDDYVYAQQVRKMFPTYAMFLSAGNDAGATVGNPGRVDERSPSQIVMDLVNTGRRLANWTMIDPLMKDVRVQVQNHVLYWGNERGR